MSTLTIESLAHMNQYDIHKQNRWLLLGCLLDFDRKYTICCRRHLDRKVSKMPAASPVTLPGEHGFSDLGLWESLVLSESTHGHFVESSRHHFMGGGKAKIARLSARTLYRCHIWWNMCKPALKTIAVPVLVALVTAVVVQNIPLRF